jgi:pyruvate kinase
MMDQIAQRTEAALDYHLLLQIHLSAKAATPTDAISQGSCEIAYDLDAAAIIASTSSGQTARMIARGRPRMPVLGVTANAETFRRLALSWGVRPLLVQPTGNTDAMLGEAVASATASGLVRSGDCVVVTAGIPVGVPGNTNLIKVQRV